MKSKLYTRLTMVFATIVMFTNIAFSQTTIEVPILFSEDDAEEVRIAVGGTVGDVDLTSSDLELVFDADPDYVGLIFRDVQIPKGATITEAYVQFTVDALVEGTTDVPVKLEVWGGLEGDATLITGDPFSVSSRPFTTSMVPWEPGPSVAVGDAGENERTPDISAIITEITSLEGWASGNNMCIIVTTGDVADLEDKNREMESADGDINGVAKLVVTFEGGGPVGTEVPIAPADGFVNQIIMADTNTDGSRKVPDAIYVLERDGHYYFQGPFENRGFKLHMKAAEGTGKRPYVQSYPDLAGAIAGNMITGWGDIELENIYFDCDGPDPAANGGGRVIRSEFVGAKIDVRGCVFANCGQNGVMLPKATEYCKMDNCLFVNQGIIAFHDFGNGRVFDCRDSDIGLFSLTNSTFVNNVDRIVRHRGGSGVMDKVIVDHCTVINSMAYHGFIELGGVGTSVQLTNLLMVDCMGLGSDSTDATRLLELDAHGELDGAGNPRMVWVGSIPNDTTTFEIHNNIYTNTPAQEAWYASIGWLDEGPNWILTEEIKSNLSAEDLATAWVKKDFTLPNIPDSPVDFYEFYWDPAGANKQKITTALVDMDARGTEYWLDTLDCQLITDDNDFMGSDGEVIGDPNWKSEISGTGVANNYASGIEMLTYPNPFSEQATIQFTLDKSTSVSIDIYDIMGKSVRKINAGNYLAGENSIVIQRENLIPGIYILKMNAGDNSGFMRISVK